MEINLFFASARAFPGRTGRELGAVAGALFQWVLHRNRIADKVFQDGKRPVDGPDAWAVRGHSGHLGRPRIRQLRRSTEKVAMRDVPGSQNRQGAVAARNRPGLQSGPAEQLCLAVACD